MKKYKLQNTNYIGICLLFVAWCLVFASGVWACSCLRGTPEQYFNDADVVFVGKVLDIEQGWGNEFEVKFEIVERQKIEGSDKTIVVRTAVMSSACGYSFEPDVIYVVYAIKEGDRLYTDLCSGNHKHYGK